MNKTKHLTIFFVIINMQLMAQVPKRDSIALNMPAIFGQVLNGNMPDALKELNQEPKELVLHKFALIRDEYIERFTTDIDESNYAETHGTHLVSLLKIYQRYWHKSFTDYPNNYDAKLKLDLSIYFKIRGSLKNEISSEKLDTILKNYVKSKGFYTTGFSKTGKYFNLLVWKTQRDTVYKYKVHNHIVECPVYFMQDFETLGWQEYATFDRIFPGGWAKSEGLYCVRKSYDLKSERFLVSFLAHEGQHYQDYKDFPDLSNPDLEYRAKLTELELLDTSLWEVLQFFIATSNENSKDGHQLANYYVIRDLSRELFATDFEGNIETWKSIGKEKINAAALDLFRRNTEYLKRSETPNYIHIKEE